MSVLILGLFLIFFGYIFYKYTLKAEIEDKEHKPREIGIAVVMIGTGIIILALYFISIFS